MGDEDRFAVASRLATARLAIIAAGATAEVVVYEDGKEGAEPSRVGAHKAAILTVVTDQALEFFHRHKSDQTVAAGAAQWHDVLDDDDASPTALAANDDATEAPHRITVNFFGDAHRLVLKTTATPPTVLEMSLRFVDRAGI